MALWHRGCWLIDRSGRSRRSVTLDAELLEMRATPAAMSAYEVHELQIVNQMRADPAAFANDLKLLYQGGVYQSPSGYAASDPIWTDLRSQINYAEAHSSWKSGFTSAGSGTFLSVASALAAKAPLVWESNLQDGSVGHDQWMYVNVYAHSVFTQGAATSTWETPSNHIPGIPRNYSGASQGDFFNFTSYGLNAAGEDISYAYNLGGATYQAYKNGQISLTGYYQRVVYADIIGFMMEYNNGDPSHPFGHLQNLASDTSGSYNFNVIGMSTYLYENPAETFQDGVAQSYFSTHRLGLRSNASYVNFLAYQDLNNNNVYDAGEGVPAQVTYNFGAGSLALPGTGYSDDALPASGTFTISASYLGNSLGSQQFIANGANKTVVFKVGATQATSTVLTSTPNASTGGSLVTFTATVSPSPGNLGTVNFLDNGQPMTNGSGIALVNGVATFQISTLSPGSHPVTASYSGATGFGPSTSNTVNQVVATVPAVLSVTPNANIAALAGPQHSRIASLVVVFNEAVQLDANAMALTLHTNNVVWNGVAQPGGYGALPTTLTTASSDKITWIVTFPDHTENGADGINSLTDGVYDFNVAAAKVHPLGIPGINMAANAPTTVFHRLFGDTSGPTTPGGGTPGVDFGAVVNSADNLDFLTAFNNSSTYKAFFDFTGDATINSVDNFEILNRFNRALVWKA